MSRKEKAMLSKTKYSGLCVLGTEVLYVLCLVYGALLAGRAQELHHSLFELLPGVAWGNPLTFVWGAVLLGVLALIVGWYVAWMHNISLMAETK